MGPCIFCRKWTAFLPLFLVPLLSGCPIPIPPGYEASSRENIKADTALSLQVGLTTRREVLLRLGEADGAAENGSWLAYGSAYRKGGVIFVVAAPGGVGGAGGELLEYRRLLLRFDGDGIMRAADFVSRECWNGIIGADSGMVSTPPCLDIGSPDPVPPKPDPE